MEPERARTLEVGEFVLDPEDSLRNVSPPNEDAVEDGTFTARFNVRVRGYPCHPRQTEVEDSLRKEMWPSKPACLQTVSLS
jgi:hypothetical protein